jgi:hypothetical protein
MATITLQINGTTVGDMSVTNTLSSDMSDRLMAYLTAAYGTTVVDGVEVQRSPQEMVEAYWAGVVAGTAANVERHERQEAAKSAAAAVPPFSVE